MREIKFRAWDKIEKKWFYYDIDFIIKKGVTKPYDLENWCQYTGLKDKNGKEIYEGDILKDDVGDILEVKFGELPLDKSGDCVCTYQAFYCKPYGQLGKAPMYQCENIGEWMEIIGNIYETPDLLDSKGKE